MLDVSKGAKRELLLEPGASLSVRLANVQPERYAALEKRATVFVRRTRPDGNEMTVWSRSLEEWSETEAQEKLRGASLAQVCAVVAAVATCRRLCLCLFVVCGSCLCVLMAQITCRIVPTCVMSRAVPVSVRLSAAVKAR